MPFSGEVSTQEELLRKLRGHLAYKAGVEPYVVFNDQSLAEILQVKPKTLDDLSKVKGFPREGKRISNWGEAIIAIFNSADKIESFEVKGSSLEDMKVVAHLKKLDLFK